MCYNSPKMCEYCQKMWILYKKCVNIVKKCEYCNDKCRSYNLLRKDNDFGMQPGAIQARGDVRGGGGFLKFETNLKLGWSFKLTFSDHPPPFWKSCIHPWLQCLVCHCVCYIVCFRQNKCRYDGYVKCVYCLACCCCCFQCCPRFPAKWTWTKSSFIKMEAITSREKLFQG